MPSGLLRFAVDRTKLHEQEAVKVPVLFLLSETVRAAALVSLMFALADAARIATIEPEPVRRIKFIVYMAVIFGVVSLMRHRWISNRISAS